MLFKMTSKVDGEAKTQKTSTSGLPQRISTPRIFGPIVFKSAAVHLSKVEFSMRMFTSSPAFWRDRLLASGLHLGLSMAIAMLAAMLVFGLWYPYPYRELSGGRELFFIVVTVDVVMGPLITMAIFNRTKPRSELGRDLAIVGVLQAIALAYGLWTVSVARPVHLVFEIDRFRVVHAIDVPVDLLDKTPDGITALPLTGPSLLGVRAFKDEAEKVDVTIAALQGLEISFRPDLWQPYTSSIADVLRAAKPARQLAARFESQVPVIEAILVRAGRTMDNTLYLPLAGRKDFWTAFVDPVTAGVVAVMPLDSF
ncbi:TfpX/TfpZ family type IV pilin accessory protein [Rhodoferax saidenbachensis]|uniref:Pilus assembly protein n=1 Tax=Rhodoferax saidenbachensis TaxID=1484693 RepID=A0ABU1ZRN6_9BURK|nr:TfpX/TfpZ family type IV pilin accessory protein [Rhodoferax saidenbachensis]MDR7307216.1 hypothetical protein [Rhodoferax saidenbachensis]